jgi:DNA polymerase-3 subunit beta
MKLTCTQENLNKALSIVGKITNKNTALPILDNILIKTDKGGLRLSSTNLELGIDHWIGGKVEEEGEITVPSKLFSNFVSNLPNGNVEMKLRDEVLSIKCNGYRTNIKGLSAKEYPLIPKMETDPVFKVENADFKKAILQVLPAVSNSESRVELTGIFLNLSQLNKNKLVLVSTDSYRLAEKTVDLEKDNTNKNALDLLGGISSIIIPKNAVQELIRSLDDEEGMLEVKISENQILFNFGNSNIISRLIDGKYPDYKQIIPDKFESKSLIDTSEIINAVRVASLFVDASNNSVELKLVDGSKSLEISAETNEVGNNNTKIQAETSGKSLKVTFNYKYLIDGLNSISGSRVILEVNSETLPTVLSAEGDKSFLYVIMPIRT